MTGKRSQASGLSVEQLFDNLLVLLDGEPSEDAPVPDSILTVQDKGMVLTHGLPTWAHLEAQSHHSHVVTTSDQYVILVEIASAGPGGKGRPVMLEGIRDTGTTRTLTDMVTTRAVGLTEETAHGLEFGTYFGPGSKEKPYVGRVVGPVVLHFGKDV